MVNEADLHESTRAMLAAVRAVQARKAGKPYNKALVPQQESETFTVADVFPGLHEQMKEATDALHAAAFTAENKARPVPFSKAGRHYYTGLPFKLFEIAMEKTARTMRALTKSNKILVELEARIIALEKATVVAAHRGTFAAGKSYSEGTLITHGGSLWLATRHTNDDERPGRSDAWRLVVKSGYTTKVFPNE